MMKAEHAYRTISEVADLLQIQASVLRFWETQFRQIKSIKRMGRRYYRAEDVVLLARIRDYLYKEGYTIKGVQKRLKTEAEAGAAPLPEKTEEMLHAQDAFVQEMSEVRDLLAPHVDA